LERPGGYRLQRVPPGSWYVHAHRLAQVVPGLSRAVAAAGHEPVMVGSNGPIVIGRGENQTVKRVDVLLDSARIMDPPVLLAVPDARTLAFRPPARDAG
jgi:hypothetical protein